MGPLTHRFGTWPLVVGGFSFYAVAFGTVGVSDALALVLVATAAWGIGEALTIVPLQAYATEIAPAEFRGVVVATFVAGARLGQTSGPLMAGALLTTVTTGSVFVLGAGFALASALALAAARGVTSRKVDVSDEYPHTP
jgi:hypothetical protein